MGSSQQQPHWLACSQERPRSWCLGGATPSLAPPGKPSSAPLPCLSAACQQLRDGKLSPSPQSHITPTSPTLSLLAPGSWEAIPNELARSLAFTTPGTAVPCTLGWEAGEGKEPSPHTAGRGRPPSLGFSLVPSGPRGELSLGVATSPKIRGTRHLCRPELFSKPQSVEAGRFWRVV